jgi:cytoskeletal protein RodZ
MAEIGIPDVKSWRRRKGISLESIAASTKLSVRQLDAIENGDFKRLPGGIYNTSYIRQYAQAIGFDETDLLAYYYQVVKLAAGQTVAAGSEDTRSIALDDLRKRRIPCPATVPPAEVR